MLNRKSKQQEEQQKAREEKMAEAINNIEEAKERIYKAQQECVREHFPKDVFEQFDAVFSQFPAILGGNTLFGVYEPRVPKDSGLSEAGKEDLREVARILEMYRDSQLDNDTLDRISELCRRIVEDIHQNQANVSSTGAERISEERRRQVSEEQWTPEHDDQWKDGQLLFAAESYLQHARLQAIVEAYANEGDPTSVYTCPSQWPWDSEWWKPSDDPLRNLEKAGALIAAEIDRIQRFRKLGS